MLDSISRSNATSRAESLAVLGHVCAGRLQPVVDSVLPLADARRAHERIEARVRA